MYVDEKPRLGQSVYDASRKTHGNGVIVYLNRADEVIKVKFSDGSFNVYDYADFDFAWTDRFGGMWYLEE